MREHEILKETPWSHQTFLRALQSAAKRLETADGAAEALETAIILSEYIAQLQANGKMKEIREYSQMLHTFLLRHPKLKRVRDLDPAEQFAIRIDLLFQQLFAMQRITTTAEARNILRTESRSKVLEALVEANDWMTTTELVEKCGLSTRQHLHQIVGPLREAGLVQSTSGSVTRHLATLLGHQMYRELNPKSLMEQINAKEGVDPNISGIAPPLASTGRRS